MPILMMMVTSMQSLGWTIPTVAMAQLQTIAYIFIATSHHRQPIFHPLNTTSRGSIPLPVFISKVKGGPHSPITTETVISISWLPEIMMMGIQKRQPGFNSSETTREGMHRVLTYLSHHSQGLLIIQYTSVNLQQQYFMTWHSQTWMAMETTTFSQLIRMGW